LYGSIENIPSHEVELYELSKDLILAESLIESTLCYKIILKLASEMDLSKASEKVVSYAEKIYFNNRKLLEKGFTPETNNVMKQLFSLINDVMREKPEFGVADVVVVYPDTGYFHGGCWGWWVGGRGFT
jgi:hypothetical protein